MTHEAVRQAQWITLPTAGNVQVFNVTSTQQVANLANFNGWNLCALRAYIHVFPDGANVSMLVSSNATVANALNTTATTGNTACASLVSGTLYPFKVGPTDTYMGLKSATAVQLRISIASPPRIN